MAASSFALTASIDDASAAQVTPRAGSESANPQHGLARGEGLRVVRAQSPGKARSGTIRVAPQGGGDTEVALKGRKNH